MEEDDEDDDEEEEEEEEEVVVEEEDEEVVVALPLLRGADRGELAIFSVALRCFERLLKKSWLRINCCCRRISIHWATPSF